MTNGSPNTPPEPSEQPSFATRLRRFIRRPSTQIGGGVLILLGIGGYLGVRYFVYEKLSPLVSTQLSNYINRKVNIGKVESFSLTHIRFGTSSIPATPTDLDTLSLKAVDIKFDWLPFLLGRPLPLDVTIVDPNLYLDQDKNGKWTNIELPKNQRELPIDFDLKVRLEDADLDLKPYALKKIIPIQAAGNLRYTKTKVQDLQYNLDVALLQSQVNVKGQSVIESGKTRLNLTVNRLALTELVTLIPNAPLKLNSGVFNANLNLNVPSFENIEGTQGQGQVSLSQLAGRIPSLQAPLNANIQIRFQGQKVLVDAFDANVNNIVAQAKGSIDWQQGYNLNVEIKPFKFSNLARLVSLSLPLKVDGQLQLKFKITGAVTQPLIIGNINNKNPVLLDKLSLRNINANFRTNLNQLWVKNLQIQPTGGGQITANGIVQLGILKSWQQKRPIVWGKMPLTASFKGAFPAEGILKPYVNFPQAVSVGTINTEGKLQGTFDKLTSTVAWQTPNLATVSDVKIAGSGNILWAGPTVLIRDTQLQTDQGNLNVEASGNFKRKDWITSLTAKTFDLDPFVAILCGNVANLCGYTTAVKPVRLQTANIQLAGRLDRFGTDTLKGIANLDLNVQKGTVAVNSQILAGNINANIFASQLALSPFLPNNISIPVNLVRTSARLSGPIEDLLNQNWNRLQANADINLQVNNNPVNVISRLNGGLVQAVVNTSQIPLNQFLPNLTVPVSVQQTRAIITGSLEQILNRQVNSLTASANVRLNIANSPANLIANVENGLIEAAANLNSLSLNRVLPQLPVAANLNTSQLNLSGNLQSLVSSFLEGNLNLNDVRATANVKLGVAQGTVTALARLNNNQWQSSIVGSNINTAQLVRRFAPKIGSQYTNLPDTDARLFLSGSILPLLARNQAFSITANNVEIALGEQIVNARGNIRVTDLFTRPDASANLLVTARTNLNQLPTTQLLAGIPNPQGFLPKRLDLGGKANFDGRLIAQNLLTAPTAPGNLQLAGNLNLINFAFNNRPFDPLLKGSVQVTLGQNIAIDLRGKQDIIAAVAEPCTRQDCLIPYLPVSFTFREYSPNQPPILATGRREGERFIAQIESFPLQVLNISPFSQYGLPGVVQGIVNLNADINLFSLATSGNLKVNQPAIGIFRGDNLQASFTYADKIAQLASATLVTRTSEYNLKGSFNFGTGAIFAKANVDNGNIEDILAAVGTPDIATLISWIQRQPSNLLKTAELPAYALGNKNAPLDIQVNLYARIAEYIKALAREREKSGVPTQLDLMGVYQASLTLAGTLQNPEANVQFQGSNWTWNPQPSYPNIIDPLGFVIQDTRTIPINEITLQASLNNGVIAIEPARLRVQNSVVFFQGQTNLASGKLSGNFGVNNLSTDTINNFVTVPLDLAGNLNIGGNLSGNLNNPQVAGNFSFNDAAFNARLLNQTIAGNFTFTDGRFQLATNNPSFVQISASVPYPPLAKSDRVEASINLGTEALKLVNIFTSDQISWLSGEGRVTAMATGRLVTDQGIKISDLVVHGGVLLNNAAIATATFPEILTVNSQIVFDRQLLNVQQLSATFAESQIAAQGVLPFFEALSPNNRQSSNPLTVVVQQGDINLEGLYRGLIDGRVVVNGSALKPIIGGTVRLSNGQVFVPERREEQQQASPVANQWLLTSKRLQSSPVSPQLNNLQIILDRLRIEQNPLYEFDFGGEIALNGTFKDLNSLQPTGTILLSRGIVNFVDTRFLLDRRYQNEIVFDPIQGLFNPDLNIRMRTIISDFPNSELNRQVRAEFSNEIPDDSLNKVERIDVTLAIDGRLSQILPGFSKDISEICQIFPTMPPVTIQNQYTQQQLNQLETCLRAVATTRNGKADEQLLASSAITLSSSPPRSEAQIINLLGNQLLNIAEALQGKNTQQLVEYGVVQLAFPLVLQNVAYDIENTVAKSLNMADFRFLPYLEAIYRVGKNDESFVRISYDYNFNEVRVRYERKF
ncbi:translocation/assembly module TamB domain-containing protein [Gloeothece verrucosa]|uniref:Translocation and assembly module TamB C-terminal domain-containing protein n=1 Tax=Gloeothece verrucosa (strain PCC 7822) TaxID=497965 RepID=E0UBK7_GLOV7|nr:translocation/assembly module TamB domain-containing protein [Gloeothece verrucosa]ADN13951.1 protein of unknown function DUF490 [Gloeothece verrucosa PCC 7822]